jgi:hypothetical protein
MITCCTSAMVICESYMTRAGDATFSGLPCYRLFEEESDEDDKARGKGADGNGPSRAAKSTVSPFLISIFCHPVADI